MGNIDNVSYKLEISGRKIEIFKDPGQIIKQFCDDFIVDNVGKNELGKY